MNYELLTSEALFTLFRDNILTLAGAITSMIGDDPIPDIRVMAPYIKDLTFDEFVESIKMGRDEIIKNMDVQEIMAKISQETVEIQKELLKRY